MRTDEIQSIISAIGTTITTTTTEYTLNNQTINISYVHNMTTGHQHRQRTRQRSKQHQTFSAEDRGVCLDHHSWGVTGGIKTRGPNRVSSASAFVVALKFIGVIYGGTRGTGTPSFRTGDTVLPLFRTHLKNVLSSEAIYGN